jgi:hypothetical protein
MARFVLIVVLLGVVTAACGGGAGRASTTATTAPVYSGDPASHWCTYANQVQGTTQLNGSFQQDPKAWVAQVTALMTEAQAAAPAAIDADVATMAGAVRGLATALSADHDDFSQLNPEQLAAIQDPAFVAAGQRVRAYDQQVCHTPN